MENDEQVEHLVVDGLDFDKHEDPREFEELKRDKSDLEYVTIEP